MTNWLKGEGVALELPLVRSPKLLSEAVDREILEWKTTKKFSVWQRSRHRQLWLVSLEAPIEDSHLLEFPDPNKHVARFPFRLVPGHSLFYLYNLLLNAVTLVYYPRFTPGPKRLLDDVGMPFFVLTQAPSIRQLISLEWAAV